MKTQQLIRFVSIVAFGAIALYAVGSLASSRGGGGGGEDAGSMAGGVEEPAVGAGDDVMAQIDLALGRPTDAQTGVVDPEKAPLLEKNALNVAPASRNGGVGSTAGSPPQPNGAPLATLDDRKIVQTASLQLQVEEVGASFEEVGRLATAAGGFVASSSFAYKGEDQIASVTVRVPAARFQEVLGGLRRLGVKVDGETSNASDVTEQYSDLSARLRNLEATEAQLLTLLGKATTIGDVLMVQDRLNAVRSEIEQVKGRMNLLDKLSDLATITVHLRPEVAAAKVDGGGQISDAVSEAWDASIEFLGGVAAVVVTGVVFLWWLPLVGAPAYGVWRSLARRHSATALQ